MLRQKLMSGTADVDPLKFRWRGGEVSRVEGFSDAVFGFAITLLIVSLEVPRSFDDLVASMYGFAGFAICFALLSLAWYDHYVFFRKYGLTDLPTIVLNLILLFVVMFYVYPLKFLVTLLMRMFVGVGPAGNAAVIHFHEIPALMLIYGAGYVAVYLVFTCMHANAWRQREALELNALERFDTLADIGCNLVLISVGVLSMLLALGGTSWAALLSGLTYWLIGPAMAIYWPITVYRRKALEAQFTRPLEATVEPPA
jgi:uncharacterized membrane protein